ncbi:hypothetical protein TSOC_009422 [Tetrabaena socialis]|uniref:Uncharacterized protein n=1 Tax=Tetrabaena socialis TaxID=47790 RepID=A0A2J7ZVX5_9CHLO|nr:hypothetical protein TSOC_009422 [Tetrabaena socialis]|eukprot:PNH04419.1 hypothetical protein TSOC_009422 [Tetrabaena socialis]
MHTCKFTLAKPGSHLTKAMAGAGCSTIAPGQCGSSKACSLLYSRPNRKAAPPVAKRLPFGGELRQLAAQLLPPAHPLLARQRYTRRRGN